MCAEYGRKKAGKKTRTEMNARQLKDFCAKRQANPHLSGALDFVGVYDKTTVQKAKRMLKISGVRGIKVTSFQADKKAYYELYVAKKKYDLAAIRLFIKLMQTK